MVEQIERPQIDKTPPPAGTTTRRRRPLLFVVGLLVGLVVYSFAFEATDVDLGEIQSETRRESLANILRALARPDLVTYDNEEVTTEIPVAIPCGPAVPDSDNGLAVTPSCASPGETVVISGSGFDPGEDLFVRFVPDSEFDVTLNVSRLRADDSGTFSVEYVIPDRASDRLQTFQVITAEPIGSWGDRQEVWTDANDNGVEDTPEIATDGGFTVSLAIPLADIAGAAIVDSTRTLVSFVSFGEPFTAASGVVNGQSALRPDEIGDVDAVVTTLAALDDGTQVTVEGRPGTNLSGWRVALYDAATGEQTGVDELADVVELSPRISQTTKDTWEKIVETVMLALVATTAGLFIAVPLSFLAARNIMRDISSTVTNLTLTLLAVPAGALGGVWAARVARGLSDPLRDNLGLLLVGLVAVPLLIYGIIRWAIPPEDREPPTPWMRAARRTALILAGAIGLVGGLLLGELLDRIGSGLQGRLGVFDFVATFFRTLTQLIDVLTPALAALLGAGVAANLAAKLGYQIRSRSPLGLRRVLNVLFGATSGAVWFALIGTAIDWFYRFDNPLVSLWIPAAVGGLFGTFMAMRGMRTGQVKIGLTIYYIARTIFNSLRSIEPLVMVIVFVVWVGFGAFAGSLALALHTAAALAKLYSEQVESIAQGPIEAVRATGATRLQTVVYAVVPQIVPPYISFTMYRWDINVRMSTILGFAGGGGIGFLLQQNVQLLQYRAAAVQMLAIAIVVASMDYISARLRERIV